MQMKKRLLGLALSAAWTLLAGCSGSYHDVDTDPVPDGGPDSGAGDYWTDGTCNGPGEPSSASCDDVGYAGCCDAEGRVIWCDGSLYCIDCAALDPACGWSSDGYYDCATEGGADPAGAHPIDCD
jgi:hypothetical protein